MKNWRFSFEEEGYCGEKFFKGEAKSAGYYRKV